MTAESTHAEPPRGSPPADVDVTAALVHALLQSQHPDLAGEPLRAESAGWDNTMFRLGERWAVRLPRRALAAQLCLHEQAWLPQLAPSLPLPIPTPVRVGVPGCGYPWHWSVVPWLSGVTADLDAPHSDQGPRLAAFLNALHAPAAAGAPMNAFRGVPLRERLDMIELRLRRLQGKTDVITDRVRSLLAEALDVPIDVEATWVHGDLHARNVLVKDGVITGIIDWGDLCKGDRATDLACIWMLLDERSARAAAMRHCTGVSEDTWVRARGWAIFFGVVLLDLVASPRHAAMGRQTLLRVAEGP